MTYLRLITNLFILTAFLAIGLFVFSRMNSNKPSLPSPSIKQTPFCHKKDLQATAVYDAGAGNIGGIFTLKNVSKAPCVVSRSQYVTVNYPQLVKNIAIKHNASLLNDVLTVAPGKTIEARARFPNGPQCSGPTHPIEVSFFYDLPVSAYLPSLEAISFSTDGKDSIQLNVCQNPAEITTIDIEPFTRKVRAD